MLTPSTRLNDGRYVLTRFLRAGGAGVVWAARDTRPRKADSADVAIKVLDASAGGSDAASREAEVAARVRHPNVVRVRDTFVHDGLACMVMDLARGSLADLVARVGPLPPPVALGCALQACEALAEAHRAGVVHRDVKPHNLLIFDDGSVRLADFGAARALVDGHTRTRTGALLGSIPFMAPEQRRDPRAVRPSTDVYALAVTLAWLLLGESPDDPWTEEAAAQLRAAGVPEGLVRAVAIGGARRAEERPQDGAAFAEALRGCGVVASVGGLGEREAWGDSGGVAGERGEGAGSGVDFWGGGPRPPATPPGRRVYAPGARSKLLLGVTAATVLVLGAAAWTRAAPRAPEAAPSADVVSASPPPCPDAVVDWVEHVHMGPRETTDGIVVDLDEDGIDDAIFTNQYDETVSVWWGRRGAMPDTRQDIPIGRSQFAVAVGDVDGDGRKDIVASLQDDSAFAYVRALGNRTFAAPERVFQSPPPGSVILADQDADGDLDLIYSGVLGGLHVRERDALNWRPHRQIRDVEGLRVTHATERHIATTARSELFLQPFRGGQARLQHGLLAWIRSADAGPNVYAIGGDVVLHMDESGSRCAAAPVPKVWRISAIGDLNDDGVHDAIAIDSCRMCTSNHVFLEGVYGAD